MIKLLLHESKRRVGSPGVFITPGTYFIISIVLKHVHYQRFLAFFKNCLNFQGKYLVSVKFSKDGLFTPKSRGSKVPVGMELDPAPPRPFEKNRIVNCIFIK